MAKKRTFAEELAAFEAAKKRQADKKKVKEKEAARSDSGKKRYPEGMSMADKRRQREAEEAKRSKGTKGAGVVKKTPEQVRTEEASKRRDRLTSKSPLRGLQDALAPKEEKKKKRTR